jgi:hypothetical protein
MMARRITYHKSLTAEVIAEGYERDESVGFCVGCGEEAEGVEPDAQYYECEDCGKCLVFGAEELALYLPANSVPVYVPTKGGGR